MREVPKAPGPFNSKLRKALRTRRLEGIRQLGIDRVVEFKFTGADGNYYLILELYAAGNVILTDSEYRIIALLRGHKFDETVKYAKGELYPFEYAANLQFIDEPVR